MRLVFISAVVAVTASTIVAEPIHDAAVRGDAAAVQRLLAEGTPVDQFDTTDPYGRKTTALLMATMAGRIEVIELLLDAGADPTLRSSDGPAAPHPLQVAARAGRNDILTMFLDRGADPNAPGNDAATLHGALVSRKPETVQLLLDAGALPRIEQPSIASRLSAGDPDRGQEIFVENCRACHNQPRPNTPGSLPNLWDIVGRDIASLEGVIYSDAMKAIDGDWTYDRLNSFIALPGGFAPGTSMTPLNYNPPDEQSRIDLIAYLRTLSEDPMPLPD
jgi:cytochrome c